MGVTTATGTWPFFLFLALCETGFTRAVRPTASDPYSVDDYRTDAVAMYASPKMVF